MNHPIQSLSKKERAIWIVSLFVVTVSNMVSGDFDPLTLLSALIGVTSLIFAAKGNVWAQILMIVFSILYGIISFRFRYWGEMIISLGLTLPMSVWSTMTWLRNPSEKNGNEVAIRKLNRRHAAALAVSSLAVTTGAYFLLRALHTPNIVFSTFSITTSFFSASLAMLRSSYFALGYSANDIVLIVLWIMAAAGERSSPSVIVCFVVFLGNDLYGFWNWRRMHRRQREGL